MFLLISTPHMDMGMSVNGLSFTFLYIIRHVLIDLAFFLTHFKSAAARFPGSEGQHDTCPTTRSSLVIRIFRLLMAADIQVQRASVIYAFLLGHFHIQTVYACWMQTSRNLQYFVHFKLMSRGHRVQICLSVYHF